MTPYYQRDGITIYCGEASAVMSQLGADSIDLTVTSPPYDNLRTYNGYTFDFEAIAKQLWRVTKPGGVVVWVVGDATVDGSETGTSFRQALGFMELGFNLHDTMIYGKENFIPLNHNRYEPQFEYMFICSKNQPRSFNPILERSLFAGRKIKRSRNIYDNHSFRPRDIGETKQNKIIGNIWVYTVGGFGTENHPGQFPEALARDHIISWSNPGDIVLDPMLGSGTTAKLAQHLGRRFVGCDISEDYCRIAVDRLRQPSFFSLPAFRAEQPKAEQAAMELGD